MVHSLTVRILLLFHVLWQTPHTGMFDTVCMERIQPFDDSIPPDDEEVQWWCIYCSC